MSFVTITSGRYAVGAPVAIGLFADIVNDLNFLNGVNTSAVDAGGAPLILNGSFESPSVATSTTPDSWTIVNGNAGAAILINTDQNHGAQSLKFVRDTTAGHSGGTATSPFFNVSGGPTSNTGSAYVLTFMIKSSRTDVSNTVVVNWYAADQSSLSSTTVFSETTGTTAWTTYQYIITPPATACFGKVVLSGGTSTTTPASTASIMFDGVSACARPPFLQSSAFGSSTTFTIPNGCYWARVRIWGCRIGGTSSSSPYFGGYCEKTFRTTPGSVATITVTNTPNGTSSVSLSGNSMSVQNANISIPQGSGGASGGTIQLEGGSTADTVHISIEY